MRNSSDAEDSSTETQELLGSLLGKRWLPSLPVCLLLLLLLEGVGATWLLELPQPPPLVTPDSPAQSLGRSRKLPSGFHYRMVSAGSWGWWGIRVQQQRVNAWLSGSCLTQARTGKAEAGLLAASTLCRWLDLSAHPLALH